MNKKSIKQVTIDTYNNSAKELAEYFRGIGSRVEDIEKAMEISTSEKPDALEIGCGDGRDALEIVKRCNSYIGFDISEELIKIAKDTVNSGNAIFKVADAIVFDYGSKKYDVVFAFASLLHLDKNEVESVLEKVHRSLRDNGVIYLSLKHADEYREEIKKDEFGVRQFFFYNHNVLKSIVDDQYDIVDLSGDFTTAKNTKWMDLILIKK